jgi:hypothetical protein
VEPDRVIAAVREVVWSIDRELPVARVRTMDQLMEEAAAVQRLSARRLRA